MGARAVWLTFEKTVTEQDSDGNQVTEWIPAFDLNPRMPCKVSDLSGRELFAAQAVQSKVTARVEVRFRPGFVATMRGRAPDGTLYNIAAVTHDRESRRRWITLHCSTGVNEG